MKLRTKIILLSSIAVLSAMLFGNLVIWFACARVLRRDAIQNAYYETITVAKDYGDYTDRLHGSADDKAVEYFFKNRKDDMTVLFLYSGASGVSYNMTVFSESELNGFDYQSYKPDGGDGMEVCIFRYHGVHYTVARYSSQKYADYTFFHFTDRRDMTSRLRLLAIGMTGVCAVAVSGACVFLYLSLRRAFKPLGQLSETAGSIAAGSYDKRVDIHSEDEIGVLGRDFNKMADAVEKQLHELQDSEQKKTVFMGDLTHELRTPLTAISGYAQTLRSVKLDREDEDVALKYIYEECKRLERLSGKMMRLLELDSNTELELVEIQIVDLFYSAVRLCRMRAEEKNIALTVLSCEGTVVGDFDLMTDVLVNLIDNAIKASSAHSEILLYSSERGITVEDHGCGIPEDEKEKILEPFYMIDKSRSRKSGGAGLGLALTALILKRHHMALEIESEVGRGTKMTIFTI